MSATGGLCRFWSAAACMGTDRISKKEVAKGERREPIRSSSIQGGHSALLDRGHPERNPLAANLWLTPHPALRRVGARHTDLRRTPGHSRSESNTPPHPTPD